VLGVKVSITAFILALLFLVLALFQFVSSASANPVPYPSEPNQDLPTFKVESPKNDAVYSVNTVKLVFNVTKPDSWNSYWLGVTSGLPVIGSYSVFVYLDGNLASTYYDPSLRDVPTTNYTAVLNGLANGVHRIDIDVEANTFYENPTPGPHDLQYFTYSRNISDTIHFTINSEQIPSQEPAPEQETPLFATLFVASSAIVATVAIISAARYIRKNNRNLQKPNPPTQSEYVAQGKQN
jgi:hypothetical protein